MNAIKNYTEPNRFKVLEGTKKEDTFNQEENRWYEKTSNGLKFLPNPLAMHMLKQRDWLISKGSIYTREKGEGVFKKTDRHTIEKEIMSFLSPKYLTDQQVTGAFKILLKRIEQDEELLSPSRMRGKINFLNGVLDLKSEKFEFYKPEYHTAIQLNVRYDEHASCPRFMEFLKSALHEEDILVIQEMIGLLLTTEMKAEKAFILYGPGQTGKSTLISVIEDMIGKENVNNVPFQSLGDRFNTSLLHGKLLNTFSDLPQSKIRDTGTFKALVSGDTVNGEIKGQTPFMFQNTARFLFSTNNLPVNLVDYSSGFYRRLILIPFTNVVSQSKVNRNLREELIEERAGIANFGLEGLKRLSLNRFHFTESEKAKKLMNDYQRSNNSVLSFIEECCVFTATGNEAGNSLYDAYKKECLVSRQVAVSQREFYTQIESQFESAGVRKVRGTQSRSVEFTGLNLK